LWAEIPDAKSDQPAPSALALQVEAIRSAFQEQLAQLTAGYEKAPDADSAAALARQISLLKLDLEIQLLELQRAELAKSTTAQGEEQAEAQASLDVALEALREIRSRQSAADQPTSQP
jgi:hypothetical protein